MRLARSWRISTKNGLDAEPASVMQSERRVWYSLKGLPYRFFVSLNSKYEGAKARKLRVTRAEALARYNTICSYIRDDGRDVEVDVSRGIIARPRQRGGAKTPASAFGVVNWYPVNDQLSGWYDDTIWLDHCVAGPIRMGVPAASVTLYNVEVATNSPPEWTEFVMDLQLQAAHFAIVTHCGEVGTEAALCLQYYLDMAYLADDASDYVAMGIPADQILISQDLTYLTWGLALHPDAVRAQIKPYVDDKPGITWLTACKSLLALPSWTDAGPGTNAAAHGYANDVSFGSAVTDHSSYIQALGCYEYVEPSLVENTVTDSWRLGTMEGTLIGNPVARYTLLSCDEWGILARTEAFSGEVHWISGDEDPEDQFVVLGRPGGSQPDMAVEPDTLRIINGWGTDGTGKARYYTVSAGGHPWVQVSLYDRNCRSQRSDWIMVKPSRPDHWVDPDIFQPGDERPLYMQSNSSKNKGVPRDRGNKSELYTDVIVYYAEGGDPDIDLMAMQARAQSQLTVVNGRSLTARIFSGDYSFADINGLYQDVVAANAAYNAAAPPDSVRQKPILKLVGSPRNGFEYVMIPNNTHFQPYWWLLSPYTDLDGNGIGDGPVEHFQVETYYQAQVLSAAATEWNRGEYVQPHGAAAFIVGDRSSGGTLAGFADSLVAIFETYTEANSMQMLEPLKRSDFPSGWDGTLAMRAAGDDLLGRGIRNVIFWDLRSSQSFTEGLRGDVFSWNRKQRVVFIAPTCDVGAMYWDYPLHFPRFLQMIDRDLEGTIFVGGIGNINAATATMHTEAADVTAEVLESFSEGALYCDAVELIKAELMDKHPGEIPWQNYAQGIQWIGATCIVPGANPTAVDEPQVITSGFGFKSNGLGDGTVLSYSLPRAATVVIKVFDLRGRRVQEIMAGMQGAGAHSVRWLHNQSITENPLASGVYHAALYVDNMHQGTAKLILVK